ncbi:MAG: HD-GYP domain-containing protein [Candidatus Methylomirabilia bacterium]
MTNSDLDYGLHSPEEKGPDRTPTDVDALEVQNEAAQAVPPRPAGKETGTPTVRLKDLVKGGAQGVGRPEKVDDTSQRLRAVAQNDQTPVPSGDDPLPPQSASAETPGVVPQDAALRAAGRNRKPTLGEFPYKPLDDAKQAFHHAVAIMDGIYQSVRGQAPFSIAKAEEGRDILLGSLESSDALLLPFFSGADRSLGLAREAVNVCIVSVRLGVELDYSPDELGDLGLAALFHCVGMARLPTELIERTGPLSQAEQITLKRHPEEAARVIQGLGPGYAWLAEVVLQVHERADGSGYPAGLKGREIHEHAQLIGITDIYESLVHHRPFRRRFWPPEALKEILQRERTSFPDRVLKALIRVMAAFPIGCLVRLNTGEIGRVVAKNADLPLRPVVAILIRRGKRLSEPELIDLSQKALLHVQESVVEEMLEREVRGVRR